ncbi:MAG: hypothetical protein HOP29_10575 [Phycisphaerales bacterium]|nr:hypothetical protein [Phycisphaerales bacterium]
MSGVEIVVYAVVIGAAVLVFLSVMADDMGRVNAVLSARHRVWLKKREEEMENDAPVMTATVVSDGDENQE